MLKMAFSFQFQIIEYIGLFRTLHCTELVTQLTPALSEGVVIANMTFKVSYQDPYQIVTSMIHLLL